MRLPSMQQLDEHQPQALQDENAALHARVAELEAEVATLRSEVVSASQPKLELAPDGSDGPPLLAAAYQQISVLNTQLAHLYTELALARTEAQHLRSAGPSQGVSANSQHTDAESESQRQSQQQIAALVGDIRHLQLDLEYHQQKLDRMIEEKQGLMKELKECRTELAGARQVLEDKDQMLRHREVDLQNMREERKVGPTTASTENDQVLSALRTEAAAKDSALIVSHYELQKEKLMRDRLEQKNAKLMERMQKLMMVVETMRKELAVKERAHDERGAQLRELSQKAKQLQKLQKGAPKSARKNAHTTSFELDAMAQPSQSLPPLDMPSRSIDSAGGQSGSSTHRTARAPSSHGPRSPYGGGAQMQ